MMIFSDAAATFKLIMMSGSTCQKWRSACNYCSYFHKFFLNAHGILQCLMLMFINHAHSMCFRYTKAGSLKYHTDCAPNNGYYFIPVYDKGDYTIRVLILF